MAKECKGKGKASKYKGCGNPLSYVERNGLKTYKQKFGLGEECGCFFKWLKETDEGMDFATSPIIIKKAKTEVNKRRNKEKKEQNVKLMSVSKYRSSIIQPKINLISRLIDYGNPCIASEAINGKMNGGHYFSVGSNPSICLNLHNIFIQSFKSNHWESGDGIKYRIGLVKTFGEEYTEFIENLKTLKSIKFTKPQLIELNAIIPSIIKKLEKSKRLRTSKERIELRNEVNNALGLYPEEYSFFNIKNTF